MASYTVVFVPLRSNIDSLEGLRFFLWVKKLQELEREKDILWLSLQTLEQARYWIRSRLEGRMDGGALAPADGGGVTLDETTPVGVETFCRRIKGDQSEERRTDSQRRLISRTQMDPDHSSEISSRALGHRKGHV